MFNDLFPILLFSPALSFSSARLICQFAVLRLQCSATLYLMSRFSWLHAPPHTHTLTHLLVPSAGEDKVIVTTATWHQPQAKAVSTNCMYVYIWTKQLDVVSLCACISFFICSQNSENPVYFEVPCSDKMPKALCVSPKTCVTFLHVTELLSI